MRIGRKEKGIFKKPCVLLEKTVKLEQTDLYE